MTTTQFKVGDLVHHREFRRNSWGRVTRVDLGPAWAPGSIEIEVGDLSYAQMEALAPGIPFSKDTVSTEIVASAKAKFCVASERTNVRKQILVPDDPWPMLVTPS